MRLEDIDWAEEKISVRRSKQRKIQTYPLTTELGNALQRYLKDQTPVCAPGSLRDAQAARITGSGSSSGVNSL